MIRLTINYFCAPKSWQIADLICHTEPNKTERVMKKVKTKTEMLRRSDLVIKSVESVLQTPEAEKEW